MTPTDPEFDPDDNFANHGDDGADVDDEADLEALVWQLLLLINPGDEDAASQQFADWQEALAAIDPDEDDPVALLTAVIDWKSGFHVAADDPVGLIESLDELSARWNLDIDWGVEDAGDADFLRDADVSSLIAHAHAQLREHGYTLWTWNARGGISEEVFSGWIALRQDAEAMRALALALGIDLRPGNAH